MKSKVFKVNVTQLFLIILTFTAFQASGQFVMARTLGQTGHNEAITGAGLDAQGNLNVVGFYSDSDPQYDFDGQSLLDLPTVFGSNYGLVWAKYDASHQMQFVKSFRCMKSATEAAQITDPNIAVAPGGEVVITGTYRHSIEIEGQSLTATQTGFGENNVFIAKFDNSGNLSWLKNVDTYGATAMDVSFDSNGDVIVAGSFEQAIDFGNSISHSGSSSQDFGFLCKLAGSDGMAQALEIFEGGYPTDISLNAAGEIALLGQFGKSQIDFSDGTTLMLKTPQTNSSKLNYFVARFSNGLSPVWITQVRGNAMGTADVLWTAGTVKAMLNNTFYLAVGNDSIDGETHALAYFDEASGSVNRVVECSSFLFGMAGNNAETYFSSENDNNTLDFGTSSNSITGGYVLFGVDQNDAVEWVETAGGFSAVLEGSTMTASANSLVVGGKARYFDTITLAPNVFVLPSGTLYNDGWFARYSLGSGNVGVDEVSTTSVSLYPNPAQDAFTVDNLPQGRVFNLTIRDISGRLHNHITTNDKKVIIPTARLDAGVYFLSVLAEDTLVENLRFIKK